jgi:KUP system potassium uptake protein
MGSIPGTAVFLTPNAEMTPHALLHSLKHYKSLHEQVVILTVTTLDIPYAPETPILVEKLDTRFYRIKVQFGFMDQPDLPKVLETIQSGELNLDMMNTSFFLGRETLIPNISAEMALWREKLFVAMFRNAGSAASYFKLPPNRVIELGTQVVL